MNILWVDDEIELLKPHVKHLETKGCTVTTALDGYDALDVIKATDDVFDVVILDENMPGMGGLEAIGRIKSVSPSSKIVMLTKSEEEDVMTQAIGRQIDDYLIKPTSPAGVYACLRKVTGQQSIIEQNALERYRQGYGELQHEINMANSWAEWIAVYRKLVEQELMLASQRQVTEMLVDQKREANVGFARFVRQNYTGTLAEPGDTLMSHKLISRRVMPLLDAGQKVVLIVIDNFRLDQWEALRPFVAQLFNAKTDIYLGLLPTATQYARNALFAGLLPADIKKMYPQFWDEKGESGLNAFERDLLQTLMQRYRKPYQTAYYKINDRESAMRIIDIWPRYKQNHLNALVYNFVDMLSHARTEVKAIRELAPDEAAYRDLTISWYKTGGLAQMLEMLSQQNVTVVLTTDHGTIRVTHPVQIMGPADITTNLRYKAGKNLSYNPKEVFSVKNAAQLGLPPLGVASEYVFATCADYFVYPRHNNDFDYKAHYLDTFQHGGISMEEMLIPLAQLTPRR